MEPIEHLASLPTHDGRSMAALALEHLPVSASIVAAIRDADGAIVDFRVAYANRAASASSALRHAGLVERYAEVLRTGMPHTEEDVRLVGSFDGIELDVRVDVVATALGPDHVLSVSHDRTCEREATVRLAAVQATMGRRQQLQHKVQVVNAGLVNDLVEVQRALDRGDVDEARRHAADGAARAADVVSGRREAVPSGS